MANAAPKGVADQASVSEDGVLSAAGNVLANDTDAENDPLQVTAVNGVKANVGAAIKGTYGTLTLGANGAYTYALANSQANVQALNAGQTVTETFAYTLSDGLSHPVTATATNLLAQSEAFDTWSRFNVGSASIAVSANTGANPVGSGSTVDRVTLSGGLSGLYTPFTASGQHTFTVWARLVSGDGQFSFNYYDGADHLQAATATGAWQQFTFTFSGTGAGSGNVALMHAASQSGSGVFEFFGAQANAGATAGPYWATTGTPGSGTVTSEAVVTSTLTVAVAGAADAAAQTLSFAGTTTPVVANLVTDTWSNPLKVMPLGDSITYGWRSSDFAAVDGLANGYRAPLWYNFVNKNALVDLVGSQTTGSGYALDESHAGFPGYRTDEIAALVPNLVATQHPDSVLLMAGINDVFQKGSAAAAAVKTNMQSMLTTIYGDNPNAVVYVAKLLVTEHAPAEYVAATNAAIQSVVQQFASAGKNAIWVDTSSITLADMYDGVHLTDAGNVKLAALYTNAILAKQPLVAGTPGGSSHAIDAATASVTGSEANDLLIGDARANALSGGAGNDRLVAGGGDDVLTGGAGHDQFVFDKSAGLATVTDFSQASHDVLVLQQIPGLTSYAALAPHITEGASGAVIDLSTAGIQKTVTLAGFTGHLTSDDFLFV